MQNIHASLVALTHPGDLRTMTALFWLFASKVAPPAPTESEEGTLTPPPSMDYSAGSFEQLPKRIGTDSFPPGVPSAAACDAMVAEAVAWASCNGLLTKSGTDDSTALEHEPFSLLPVAFPAAQLDLAVRLAPLFGTLVDRIADDVPWLTRTLQSTADGDDFTKRLLRLCARTRREGATQGARLSILRADYMLHDTVGAPARLLQLELQTIAAALGCLGARVSALHTHLAQRFESVRHELWERAGRPARMQLDALLRPNDALDGVAEAIAHAHAAYGSADAVVLFVVRDDEPDALDAELLRQRLWATHGLRVVSRTLLQLAAEARLEGRKRLLRVGAEEVSVAYFRAGHAPEDYATNRHWDARLLLERSHAIKAPSVEMQLAGSTKVQQALAEPGVLERFVSTAEAEQLRVVFAGLWSLAGAAQPRDDAAAHEHAAAMHMRLASERPDGYVMRPQRGGSGGSAGEARPFFGNELRDALRSMSQPQRAGFVLMQRILPRPQPSVLVRSGAPRVGPAVSKLGVYTTYLRAPSGRVLLNRAAGHLVRTKPLDVDEGGIAGGSSVLSSPLAVRKA